MRKRVLRWLTAGIGVLLVLTVPLNCLAAGDSYTYSTASGTENVVPCPAPLALQAIYKPAQLSVNIRKPADLVFGQDGKRYVLDSDAGAVYIFDASMRLLRTGPRTTRAL